MNYPLKLRHQIGRELMCYFFGHKWKWSGHVKTEYYDKEDHEVPYSVRRRTGNYMFNSKAWWNFKCPRCRLKIREGYIKNPWYKDLYRGISNGLRSMGIIGNMWFNDEETTGPMGKRIITFLPVVLAFGFQTFYAHLYIERNLPSFPIDLVDRVIEWGHVWGEVE